MDKNIGDSYINVRLIFFGFIKYFQFSFNMKIYCILGLFCGEVKVDVLVNNKSEGSMKVIV